MEAGRPQCGPCIALPWGLLLGGSAPLPRPFPKGAFSEKARAVVQLGKAMTISSFETVTSYSDNNKNPVHPFETVTPGSVTGLLLLLRASHNHIINPLYELMSVPVLGPSAQWQCAVPVGVAREPECSWLCLCGRVYL